jgi:hypothetical protein
MKLVAALVLLGACAGQIGSAPTGGDDDDMQAPDAAIVAPMPDATLVDPAVARGQLWVDAKVPYCQAPNHKPDADSDCASTCTRPDMPDWDPYRSDCSGFVSWAWDLPAPGRTTGDFAPFVTDITQAIAAADLSPGDAVNNDTHMMLFVAWTAPGAEATFMEEPGCSSTEPYAREFTATVTLTDQTIVVKSHGTFTAIRRIAP